eukprot:3667112-Alexandrium_andersonii.AAC.1
MVASLQVHAAGAYVEGGFKAGMWERLAAVGLPAGFLEMVLGTWRELRLTDSLSSILVSLGRGRQVGEMPAAELNQLRVGDVQ